MDGDTHRIETVMLRYLTAGESHGEALIGIVEGMPSGLPLTGDIINHHLARHWLGFGRGGRAKFEQDQIHIYSGVRFSKTIAGPIAMRLDNVAYTCDRNGWPEVMAIHEDGKGIERITLPFKTGAFESIRDWDQGKLQPIFINVTGVNGHTVQDVEGRTTISQASGEQRSTFIGHTLYLASFRRLDIEVRVGALLVIFGMDRREISHTAKEAIQKLSRNNPSNTG